MTTEEAAERYRVVWKQHQKLEAEKKELKEILMPVLARNPKLRYLIGKDILQIESSRQKRPSLTLLTAFFGEKKAKEFWKTVPQSVSSWISVIPAEMMTPQQS